MFSHDYFSIDKITEQYTSLLDILAYFSGEKGESWLLVDMVKREFKEIQIYRYR